MTTQTLYGVIDGDIIRLDQPSNLPAGAQVKMVVTLAAPAPGSKLPPGEGLRRSAGAWAEDAEELDRFIEWTYEQRRNERREIEP